MSEFTCDSLLEWYHFLRQNVRGLSDAHFESFTPTEREELRAELLEEIRKDYAFKLLALLEADVRQNFLISKKKTRCSKQGVSRFVSGISPRDSSSCQTVISGVSSDTPRADIRQIAGLFQRH